MFVFILCLKQIFLGTTNFVGILLSNAPPPWLRPASSTAVTYVIHDSGSEIPHVTSQPTTIMSYLVKLLNQRTFRSRSNLFRHYFHCLTSVKGTCSLSFGATLQISYC